MSRLRVGLTLASLTALAAPAFAGAPFRCGTPAPSRVVVVRTHDDYRRPRSTYDRLMDEAWDQFERECYADAQRLFAKASRLRPQEGEANTGYALASAMCGDERAAAWAMRDAFDSDPRGVRAPRSRDIDETLCDLQRQYRSREERFPAGRRVARDEAFMLAAVSYLLDEDREARRAIECAIDLGDRSNAAYNLRDLLRPRSDCD